MVWRFLTNIFFFLFFLYIVYGRTWFPQTLVNKFFSSILDQNKMLPHSINSKFVDLSHSLSKENFCKFLNKIWIIPNFSKHNCYYNFWPDELILSINLNFNSENSIIQIYINLYYTTLKVLKFLKFYKVFNISWNRYLLTSSQN